MKAIHSQLNYFKYVSTDYEAHYQESSMFGRFIGDFQGPPHAEINSLVDLVLLLIEFKVGLKSLMINTSNSAFPKGLKIHTK